MTSSASNKDYAAQPIQPIQPIQGVISSEIQLSGSKSITNRVLLLAALAQGRSVIKNILDAKDTRVMAAALEQLGVKLKIDWASGVAEIEGCGGCWPENSGLVDTYESGTATRFLIPAVAACGHGVYGFKAEPRMMDRPIEAQLKILEALGVNFKFEPNRPYAMPFLLETHGLCLEQGLNNINNINKINKINVPIEASSQFLSGLMMVLPFIKINNLQLVASEDLKNKPYIAMTQSLMESFGVKVEIGSDQRTVSLVNNKIGRDHPVDLELVGAEPVGNFKNIKNIKNIKNVDQGYQGYQASDLMIEPDLSTASYFFALPALLGGEILVKNIHRKKSLQGDIKFLDVLEKMGCVVTQEKQGVRVFKPKDQVLIGLERVDMKGFSDTFMTVAVLAAFADKPTTLTSLRHTRLQESDRILAMEVGLNLLGIRTVSTEGSLTIFPEVGLIKAAVVDSFNDHRIAMSLSLIGLKIPGVKIKNSGAVSKTCPDFFVRLEKLV